MVSWICGFHGVGMRESNDTPLMLVCQTNLPDQLVLKGPRFKPRRETIDNTRIPSVLWRRGAVVAVNAQGMWFGTSGSPSVPAPRYLNEEPAQMAFTISAKANECVNTQYRDGWKT